MPVSSLLLAHAVPAVSWRTWTFDPGVVLSLPELDAEAFVVARQENLETIHQHNVVAERYGLVGELRGELDSTTHSHRHVTMREWLESA